MDGRGAKGLDVTDRIELLGLRAKGFHGVFESERQQGQQFVVDLVLHVDTRAAAASDDLGDTVHYGVIAQQVHDVVSGEPVDLIETLASRLAEVCLSYDRVARVEVTVHKPDAPIAAKFSDVKLTITRHRTDDAAGQGEGHR